MQYITAFIILFGLQFEALGQENKKLYQEFNLELGTEYSFFFKEGLYTGQKRHFPSISIQPEYYLESNNGLHSLTFTGFLRLDVDNKRTHWDIRELYWLTYKNNWELSAGIKKIYWGTTESIHLVDVINQTDQVETFDGEEKLGQAMVHFSYMSKIGTFDGFAMPYFRKRTFPGEKGRLRTPTPIGKDDIKFESSAGQWHPDFAIRWSNTFGVVDLGLSHFWGTGREPLILIDQETGTTDFLYPINHQSGIDMQLTLGPWLWKLEAISRLNKYQDVFAFASGFEYTFGNIKSSGLDIGVIGEYLYDSRDELTIGGMDNDIFFGSRIAFNDVQSTEILVGTIFDLQRSTKFFSIEASRRFGENWKGEIEARIFSDIASSEFTYLFRDDSFAKVSLTRFF
jgi:hypothetical protein